LSDLVSALSRLRQANGSYDFESIDCLMEGYQAVYPLLAEEWRAFPQVWRFYKLRSALIYWNNYIETGSPLRKLVSARSAVEQADWIRNHPEALMHLKLRTGEDGARAGHGLWKATRDWRS
jgi:Ser/Thr protein kinase RdoA (MazF antagonist)